MRLPMDPAELDRQLVVVRDGVLTSSAILRRRGDKTARIWMLGDDE